MMNTLKSQTSTIALFLMLLILLMGGMACAPEGDSNEVDSQVVDDEHEADQSSPASEEVTEPDSVSIEAAWLSSPHADAFVLDVEGNNNSCARCHAPVNWQPSMDELPESCFACKFELEDPPPFIAESDWVDIPCNVCHEKDKKDNIQPEYAWLEIAATEEYAEVTSPTELCQKCHNQAELPDHAVSMVGGAHSGYECTECHDAHDTVASCGATDCHEDVVDPDVPIAGHDGDHQLVSCEACHDADGLDVGPSEDDGIWRTNVVVFSGEAETAVVHTSHNIVLEAPCERCHFSNNPWGLTENVSTP